MNAFFQRVHRLDTLTFMWLHVTKQFRHRRTARWLSRCGDGPLYIAIALVLIGFQAPQARTFLLMGLSCYALEISLYLILKNAIKRDRPAVRIDVFESWFTPSDQFSFPSGHTAAAFVFACLVFIFYPAFAPAAYSVAALVGLSRVLLGVHYPSDIVAGAALGTVCAIATNAAYSTMV